VDPHRALGLFLASHSSFDTGAEWVIALGCVLTLYRTIQLELTQTNTDLLAAKEVLQELVDRDSLTGLANRRALPIILRESDTTGATILFFDLNDFKLINDSYGHQIGDDCLKRFARALQASFRPDDHVIRYAGDEFVVVAPGLDPDQLAPESTSSATASNSTAPARRSPSPSASPSSRSREIPRPRCALRMKRCTGTSHAKRGSCGPGDPGGCQLSHRATDNRQPTTTIHAERARTQPGVRWPQPPLLYVTAANEHTKAVAAAAALQKLSQVHQPATSNAGVYNVPTQPSEEPMPNGNTSAELPLTSEASEEKLEDLLALCLSGGGYRAMLFHLGTLWYLNDAGYLPKLDRVSSVSGGSITAGVLATRWNATAVRCERQGIELRTSSSRRCASWPGPRSTSAASGRHLSAGHDQRPHHLLLLEDPLRQGHAAGLRRQAALRHQRHQPADRRAVPLLEAVHRRLSRGHDPESDHERGRGGRGVVGISAGALAGADRLQAQRLDESRTDDCGREPFTTKVVLTDGGVYDNMGIETAWKRCKRVLVSDGGAKYQPEENPPRRLGAAVAAHELDDRQSGAQPAQAAGGLRVRQSERRA
jgi:hypothetical protein